MVTVHHGILFVYEMHDGWYRYIKAFPTAKDENDPAVQKYLKEKN